MSSIASFVVQIHVLQVDNHVLHRLWVEQGRSQLELATMQHRNIQKLKSQSRTQATVPFLDRPHNGGFLVAGIVLRFEQLRQISDFTWDYGLVLENWDTTGLRAGLKTPQDRSLVLAIGAHQPEMADMSSC